MSTSVLSPNPNFKHLRNQAKALLNAHQARDSEAANRLRQALPELAGLSDPEIFQAKLALKDTRRAIAHDYGFEEWTDLKRHVEALAQAGSPTEEVGNSEEVETFCRAVKAGDAETVDALLQKNPGLAHVRVKGDGPETDNLLHHAIPVGRPTPDHLQVVRRLVEAGADIDANGGIGDSAGSSALEKAAWLGQLEMIRLLLDVGANPDQENAIDQRRPIDEAAEHGHRNIVAALIEAGAAYGLEHTIKVGMLKETRTLLDADPARVNQPLPSGDWPLHLAAGKQGIFKLLLRRGADVQAKDGRGYTALMAAREAGNEKAVQELLQRGVPNDIFGAIANRDEAQVAALLRDDPTLAHPVGKGPAPIMWAVRSGSIPIIELLLEQQVELEIRRPDEYCDSSPLLLAIRSHNDELVRCLLNAGADPDPKDTAWAYPLTHALRFGTLSAATILLDAGADPNQDSPSENNPDNPWFALGWPANQGDLVATKLLMDRGAAMHTRGSRKALAHAAEKGLSLIVELLATHGADVEAACKLGSPDAKETTPLSRARRKHPGTARLIQEFIDLQHRPAAERARILRYRADFINAVIDGDADTVRQLLQEEPALMDQELTQVDLLRQVAYNGQYAVADALVEGGAPWTVVAAAALGRVEQVEVLLAADPVLLQSAEPLIAAAANDQVAVLELLLDRGANVDAQRPDGWTALHEAVGRQSVNAVEMLVARRAKVNLKAQYGYTPLKMSGWFRADGWTRAEAEKIRDLLLAHGATQ